jgi:predicted DCC family thiol-disulfide oxidoreductase YuxK
MSSHYKIILFDGICNLCNSSVDFIIRHDKKNVFRFASLQSDFGQDITKKLSPKYLNTDSFILAEGDNFHIKSGAALRTAKYLGFPFNMFYVLIIIPPFIRNFFYDIIAKNRYKWFGKKQTCRVPSPEEKQKFLG